MSIRGYAGYYKEKYLRSSYEYVFARILDYDNIEWDYEVERYKLKERTYIPDFFIYRDGKLIHVVEVKSSVISEQDRDKLGLEELRESHGIDGYMVLYEDLKEMCLERNLDIDKLIKHWIDSNKKNANVMDGEKNPHYGMKHSKETKEIITSQSKKRWEENPEMLLEASLKGAKRAKELFTGEERVPRVSVECPNCNNKFRKIKTSSQVYCGTDCANAVKSIIGANVLKEKHKNNRDRIKDFIHEWSLNNKELVLETPYNKISSGLNPMLELIEENFNVKDLRIISKSVFGEDKGRKELLRYMKDFVG